jgi:type IV secretory pathway VirD2 relaxase
VTDDGKILSIAGDYNAYGIRARSSELVTLELAQQSDWEVKRKLALEINQDRFTRPDRFLLQEANANRMVDLRPGSERSFLGKTNRYLLIVRLKKLERLGIATRTDVGNWSLSPPMEAMLKAMGGRGDIIITVHRALDAQGVERSAEQFTVHLNRVNGPIIGRLVSKGLANDELTDSVHLVIDGSDGRVHYVEIPDLTLIEAAPRDAIVEVEERTGPRNVDENIAGLADDEGFYRPSQHLA